MRQRARPFWHPHRPRTNCSSDFHPGLRPRETFSRCSAGRAGWDLAKSTTYTSDPWEPLADFGTRNFRGRPIPFRMAFTPSRIHPRPISELADHPVGSWQYPHYTDKHLSIRHPDGQTGSGSEKQAEDHATIVLGGLHRRLRDRRKEAGVEGGYQSGRQLFGALHSPRDNDLPQGGLASKQPDSRHNAAG